MDVLSAYFAVTQEPEKTQAPKKGASRGNTSTDTAGMSKYVAKAVDGEVDAVRGQAEGFRNEQLNRSAFVLGTLVGAGKVDQTWVEEQLLAAAMQAGLGEGEARKTIRSGIESGIANPREIDDAYQYGEPNLVSFDGDTITPEEADALLNGMGLDGDHNPWPYMVHEGRMCYCSVVMDKDDEEAVLRKPIADFWARIIEEITDENGDRTFTIAGEAKRGGEFRLEMPAKSFGDERGLRSALEQAAGARDGVQHKMAGHLAPAIKALTPDTLTVIRRYRRTGWADDRFLMPGYTVDGSRIELPSKLPYYIDRDSADTATGLDALDHLIRSVRPEISTPVLAMLLTAPLHRIVAWANEKYGFFIQGRTGSLKTAWATVAMSIWGPGFADESNLLKWGEGATRNALMAYATSCHDMPFLLDNYKPVTSGQNDFAILISNIMEGSDKDRMSRSMELREAKRIHGFPLVTGEDIPETDASVLARMLVVQFDWQAGQPNPELSYVQARSSHLNAIGKLWLDWVASEDGRKSIHRIAKGFDAARDVWAGKLRAIRRDTVNILRVATNLATNELVWAMALEHPVIGPVLAPYSANHAAGLEDIAGMMSVRTSEALEAQQFLTGLRELLVTKQYMLLPRHAGEPTEFDSARVLGWYDSEGVYLLPSTVVSAVRRLLGHNSLNVSQNALYGQLKGLGLVAGTAKESTTMKIRIGSSLPRVLHLHVAALDNMSFVGDDDDGAPATGEELLGELGL